MNVKTPKKGKKRLKANARWPWNENLSENTTNEHGTSQASGIKCQLRGIYDKLLNKKKMFDFACNELGQGNQKNSKWIFMVNSQNQNKRPIREIVSGIILSRIHYYFFWIFFPLFALTIFELTDETMNISAIHVEIHNARCNHFIYLRLEIAKCTNVIRNRIVCLQFRFGFYLYLLCLLSHFGFHSEKRQKIKKNKKK